MYAKMDLRAFCNKAKALGGEIKRFVWKISEGSILLGQGTEQIMVKIPQQMNSKVIKVDLQLVLDNPICACYAEFSKEIKISNK